MQESSEQKKYLHDDVEVVLTGRTATRKLRRQGKTDEKVEIKPTNPLQGSWTKWVRMSDLYTIDREN